jgi:HrpA-like RNA helicase
VVSCLLQLMQAIASHQVVLVSGETGCGKSTQLPQFILEEHLAAGKHCRVVCGQPRRLSAVSLAQRVAAERGEPVGNSVGYVVMPAAVPCQHRMFLLYRGLCCAIEDLSGLSRQAPRHAGFVAFTMPAQQCRYRIRLESEGGPRAPLQFVTYGILVKLLAGGADSSELKGVTHIVLDEVHERDKYADFAAILLLDLLRARPGLRLVLMSATLQKGVFAEYFSAFGCPVVEVPGRTFPVSEHFLEDVLQLTGRDDGGSDGAAARSERVDSSDEGGQEGQDVDEPDEVDLDLVEDLLCYICREGRHLKVRTRPCIATHTSWPCLRLSQQLWSAPSHVCAA